MGYRHCLAGGCSTMSLLYFLLLLILTAHCSSAQSPSNDKNNNNNNPYFTSANFNPSMAIVIVVLISAFFFLGFFSIYIRQCAGDRLDPQSVRIAAAGRSRRQRGLDADVLASFPTLVYSEVKHLKIGKGTLECAVCLSEFDDDETLRLLPKCSHVFHSACIDAWLAAHVTCPVCRANLVRPVPSPLQPDRQAWDEVAVEIGADADSEAEMEKLEGWHSTGHSILVQPGEDLDRYTLRLPDDIRKRIAAERSLVAFPREWSSRRGIRGGGGGGGGDECRGEAPYVERGDSGSGSVRRETGSVK